MQEKKIMDNTNIFLVEDNIKDELLTIRALKKNKVANQIDVARDGQQAIDYLMNVKRELPSLVILDLKLPKLSGLEVLKRIRADARTKFLPVVMLTSSDEEKDITEAYKNGANSFVSKPVNIDEFSKAVRDLGLYWLILNKAAN